VAHDEYDGHDSDHSYRGAYEKEHWGRLSAIGAMRCGHKGDSISV